MSVGCAWRALHWFIPVALFIRALRVVRPAPWKGSFAGRMTEVM